MSDSRDMQNEVILEIQRVTKNPAQPWVNRIIINLYNSVDSVDDYMNHDSEDIPGYMERSEREELLDEIRQFIGDKDCKIFHFEKIDKIILKKQEESP